MKRLTIIISCSDNNVDTLGYHLLACKVHRLCTEESYEKLDPSTVAEVQRSNMAAVVLQLKALGIDNVLRFHYISVSRI